jgi:hypothetical protein
MHLLHVTSLEREEFHGASIPKYAILSHTWGEEVVTFAELPMAGAKQKIGFPKIQYTCAQAIKDGLDFAWIDTCCIDKRSSAELSEAINSMFPWYKESSACYVYLSDTEKGSSDMAQSRWFTRGWTLQELIAPMEVVFYDRSWQDMGTKRDLKGILSEITGIDRETLLSERAIQGRSVAERMSWGLAPTVYPS